MTLSDIVLIGAAAPVWLQIVAGGIGGLVVGSYLATIFVRWPTGRSANSGRSQCDGCNRQLSWYELVPVIGHLSVRGRCATCGAQIAPAHFWIEAGCGALGAYLFALHMPALAPVAWLLLLLAMFDARLLWLPDRLTIALALFCLLAPAWDALAGPGERLLGGVIGFGSLWLVKVGYRALRGHDGMGGGDPKLFGAIGLWLGPRDLPLLMVAACAIGLIDAVLRWPRGADRRAVHLPLGAYLCVAAIGFAVAQPLRGMFDG